LTWYGQLQADSSRPISQNNLLRHRFMAGGRGCGRQSKHLPPRQVPALAAGTAQLFGQLFIVMRSFGSPLVCGLVPAIEMPLAGLAFPQCIQTAGLPVQKRMVGNGLRRYTAPPNPTLPAAVVEAGVQRVRWRRLKEQPSCAEATGLLMPVDWAWRMGNDCVLKP